MKKLFCFTLIILALSMVFVACGEVETTSKTTTEDSVVTTEPTTDDKVTTTDDTTTATPNDTTTATPNDTTTVTPDDTTTVKPEDTTTVTPEPETPTGKNLLEGGHLGGLAIEDHHASTDYHPTLVFNIYGDVATYTDLRGKEYTNADVFVNSKYTWNITANGKTFTPAKMSIYDGTNSEWGYFRADLGTADTYEVVDNTITFSISLKIVNNETNEVAYYADFGNSLIYSVNGILKDNTRPEGLTAVTGVVGVSGPSGNNGEGYQNLFDNSGKTKLCTNDNGADHAIVANLGGTKTLKGISLVNANDNSGATGRTVISFEIWVSENGTDWGTAAAYTTTGEGVNKADVSANYQERYYGFESAITATYVKIVVNNGEMYQISEVIFYQ